MTNENYPQDNSVNNDVDSIVTNTSTAEVGHQGASDEDPTGAIASGGLVDSDIDTTVSDEGTPITPMGAHRDGNLGSDGS
jgi:hypothetical protein